ncbi:hypothetical protein [Streptodolium elevatio]
MTEKGTATPEESRRTAAEALDALLDSLYRAAKNARDGNALAELESGARTDGDGAVLDGWGGDLVPMRGHGT